MIETMENNFETMDSIRNIDKYIIEEMADRVVRKGKSPLAWFLLLSMGLAALAASFTQGLTDSGQMLLLTLGVAAVLVGGVLTVLCLCKVLWYYRYVPTGSRVRQRLIYLSAEEYAKCCDALKEGNYSRLGNLHPQVSSLQVLQAAWSPDGAFVLLQAGRHDSGRLLPETTVARLEGAEAQAAMSWLNR